MMPSLFNNTKNTELLSDITIANDFATRAKGLMGKKSVKFDEGIWFPKCNWIHTFFMQTPIDVIYLDKQMIVRKLQPNLKPWRFPAPVLNAQSVIEVSPGFIQANNIEIGDHLDVGN